MVNSLTQEELANRADLTKGYISQLESDTTCPSIATLKDILDVFGVSMQEFFSEASPAEVVFGADARVRSIQFHRLLPPVRIPLGAKGQTAVVAVVSEHPSLQPQPLRE